VGDREIILGEITRQQAVLDRLEQERDHTRERLRALEALLGNGTASIAAAASPATSAEKVALFRRLFRGRDDIYPRYWDNPRTGRHGYAPACANEWVRGVCEKPRVKCGECPNQSFIRVSDQARAKEQAHQLSGTCLFRPASGETFRQLGARRSSIARYGCRWPGWLGRLKALSSGA
jgi:hypothetical protein